MNFVYLLRSINYTEHIYVGKSRNLKKRLYNHNCGTTEHTAKYAPWNLITYICFTDKMKAIEFEKYLKSGSGREFRNKRLL